MSRHTADTVISAALGQLDPAPRTDLTEAERGRADAAFARIVATPGDDLAPMEPDRPHRPVGPSKDGGFVNHFRPASRAWSKTYATSAGRVIRGW